VRPGVPVTHLWRKATVRIFSSASDAPLARRPTDIVLLILCVLGVVVLSVPAPGPTAIDGSFAAFVKELPGLFGWFWEFSYDLLIGWAMLLLLLALLAHGRKRLFCEELSAAALAFGFALLAGKVTGTDWSTSLRAVSSSSPPPTYLAMRLALATAVVVMASPHMSRPLRFIGRWVVVSGAIAGIAVGVTLPIGMVAGFVVGVGSAAIVHLIVGSPDGRLTPDQITAALIDLGVEATDLRDAPLDPRGAALATASTPSGGSLLVKIYGRDAWNGQLLASTWLSLWHRGETPQLGSGRLQQVEHEALVTLLAERGGVPVLPVVATGMAGEGDALLVTETTGRPLAALDPDSVSPDLLLGFWGAVAMLHALGISHGRLDGSRLIVRPDGSPALGDFGESKDSASEAAQRADMAQLLVTTAVSVGAQRAIAAASAAIGGDALGEVLPFLQPAVLDRDTKQAVAGAGLDLEDLRKTAASSLGIEPPKLERIRRVTLRSVLMVAFIGLLAYALIAALSGVDLQQLVNELKSADPVWIIGALLAAPVVQVFEAFSTMGASIHPVRFGPVLMLEYGIQFIALAVPSSAARVATEVRFFQRQGIDTGGAASIGLIDSVSGFVIQMALILVITVLGLVNVDLSATGRSSSSSSSGSSSSAPSVWILLLVLLLLGAIVALAVPKYRGMIKEAVPRYRASLREQASSARAALGVLRQPKNLALMFGGNLAAQVLLAAILGVCLRAFGYHTSLAGLILVNTFVSLFAGFMPVPGGMGVAEAGLTAGLQAIGIPSAAAMSTAIAFRLVTFYLPPIWGGFAMRWLRGNEYV
jgi:uncharacterized protein (TIRG00374 family)